MFFALYFDMLIKYCKKNSGILVLKLVTALDPMSDFKSKNLPIFFFRNSLRIWFRKMILQKVTQMKTSLMGMEIWLLDGVEIESTKQCSGKGAITYYLARFWSTTLYQIILSTVVNDSPYCFCIK